MSGAVTAAVVVAGAATAYSAYQQNKATKQQASAQREAVKQAESQAVQAERDFNSRNMKKPNAGAALAANQQAGLAGNAGTMLTGPAGVDPSTLQIGKNNLLGL